MTQAVFSEELKAEIKNLMERYPHPRAAMLPILHRVQDEKGWFSDEVVRETALATGFSEEEIRGVISFYTMFHKKPVGRWHLMLCRTLSCSLRKSDELFDFLRSEYGLKDGGITADGMFSLEGVECLAACDRGPVLQVGAERFYHLTPEKLRKVLEDLRARAEGSDG